MRPRVKKEVSGELQTRRSAEAWSRRPSRVQAGARATERDPAFGVAERLVQGAFTHRCMEGLPRLEERGLSLADHNVGLVPQFLSALH